MKMTCHRCGITSNIPDDDDEELAQAVVDHAGHRCVTDAELEAQDDVGIFFGAADDPKSETDQGRW